MTPATYGQPTTDERTRMMSMQHDEMTDRELERMTGAFDHASPRPWTYHKAERSPSRPADWIEDANGNVVIENIGHIDGPLIVASVNAREATRTTPTGR